MPSLRLQSASASLASSAASSAAPIAANVASAAAMKAESEDMECVLGFMRWYVNSTSPPPCSPASSRPVAASRVRSCCRRNLRPLPHRPRPRRRSRTLSAAAVRASRRTTAMTPFAYRDGELTAERVPLSAIAARFGTPCYVYSKAALSGAFREFDAAFEGVPHLICYAMKANSNLAVLDLFARLGSGFDIVSGRRARPGAGGGRRSTQGRLLRRGQDRGRDGGSARRGDPLLQRRVGGRTRRASTLSRSAWDAARR